MAEVPNNQRREYRWEIERVAGHLRSGFDLPPVDDDLEALLKKIDTMSGSEDDRVSAP